MKKADNYSVWLLYAESDLELAAKGKVSKKVKYDMLCFHNQQAAEKAIKAVLVYLKIDFPKTHDIEFLLKLLKKNDVNIPRSVSESIYLSKYAAISRYPGNEIEVNMKEYKGALKTASDILKWAKLITNKKSNQLF